MTRLGRAVGAALDLLYPPRCAVCGAVEPADELLPRHICRGCLAELELPRGGFAVTEIIPGAMCVSALMYGGAVRDAVHAFKFGGDMYRARGFAVMMGDALTAAGAEHDVLSWTPVSLRRLAERGYDQARLLAEELAALRGTRAVPVLRKVRHTKAQSGIDDAAQRADNVAGAYRLRRGADVRGKRVLLIDDVVTTGSTLRSAAGVLLAAGAAGVACVTFAKAGASPDQSPSPS